MPQLDFTWWIINFFLIWASVIIVTFIVTANAATPESEQEQNETNIEKNITEWQWF